MKSSPSLLAILLALPLTAAADTLYKCIDEGGVVLYTNQKSAAKNCTVLSRDLPISTFSAPKTKPSDFPRVDAEQQRARDNDRRAILDQERANEQKLLEDAKKALAEQENTFLPGERNVGGGINGAKVEARVQPYRDAVQLHERNIEALNKEISNLR
ncbi:MAG TPA: DUF4124 domain-containing protein [Rhodocyclaceae bacterium]